MATITPIASSTAGTTLTFAAASGGGDTIATAGYSNVKFLVINGGSSITVTFAGSVPCSQGSTHSVAVTVPTGDKTITIPAQCINATTGNVAVTYSAVTTVTVAAIAG